MLALVVALTATALLPVPVVAQLEYTVWSSVIFQQTGERTPETINNDPTILTSLGAQQAYAAGTFFRNRYINSVFTKSNTSSGHGLGNEGAPLFGLATDILDYSQVNANALDQQWNIATAYAFMQGLYPPWTPDTNGSLSGYVLPSNIVINATNSNQLYIDAPLGGYQYPQVHVAGSYDPNFIYLSAFYDCPNHALAANDWSDTPQFSVTEEEFAGIYDAIGEAVLLGVIPPDTWQYGNAYAIYEYLQYEYNHNLTVHNALNRYVNLTTNTSFLTTLGWLADEQNYAQLGNLTAYNPGTKSNSLPNGISGSISTIAGNYFAWNVLNSLQDAIMNGGETNKVTLLFADYQPLISFFALNGLADYNVAGMPMYGSSAVFELYSYSNVSADRYMPSPKDLWVRFFFRNGTNSDFTTYPLFHNGPSGTEMTWAEFEEGMGALGMSSVGEWCGLCGAESGFCAGYNSTSTEAALASSGGSKSHHTTVSPAVAGVIGAAVALAVAALIFGAVMLFGGLRFHRNPRRSSDLGGFKGGQKMRSDQDLTIPKGGATVVEQEGPVSPIQNGHERVGSWELKHQPDAQSMGRPSFVEDEEARDPFAHGDEHAKPVVPHERV